MNRSKIVPNIFNVRRYHIKDIKEYDCDFESEYNTSLDSYIAANNIAYNIDKILSMLFNSTRSSIGSDFTQIQYSCKFFITRDIQVFQEVCYVYSYNWVNKKLLYKISITQNIFNNSTGKCELVTQNFNIKKYIKTLIPLVEYFYMIENKEDKELLVGILKGYINKKLH